LSFEYYFAISKKSAWLGLKIYKKLDLFGNFNLDNDRTWTKLGILSIYEIVYFIWFFLVDKQIKLV